MRKFKSKYSTIGLLFSNYNFQDEGYFLKMLDVIVPKLRKSKTRRDFDDAEIKRIALGGYQHSIIEDGKPPFVASKDEFEVIVKLFSGSNQEIESYNYEISSMVGSIFTHWPHEQSWNITDWYFEEALCHFIFTCHNPDNTNESLPIEVMELVVNVANETIEYYYLDNRNEDAKYGVIGTFVNALNEIYRHSIQKEISVFNEIVKFDSVSMALKSPRKNRYNN